MKVRLAIAGALLAPLAPLPDAAAQCREIVTYDGDAQEYFGSRLALHGTTLAVSTFNYDVPNGPQDVTAVVLFDQVNGQWVESGALIEPPNVVGGSFGYTTILAGDTLLVSSATTGSVPTANATNAIYVYGRSGGVWSLVQTLESSAGFGVNFGFSMALDGDRLLVGQPGTSPNGNDSGSVAVFERSGGLWSQVGTIDYGAWSPGFGFGSGVALAGDLALIGAMNSGAHGAFSGEVRLYEQVGASWVLRQQLVPSWIGDNLKIGDVLRLTPTKAFISGFRGLGTHPANAGIVSVFRPDGNGTWAESQLLQGDPTDLGASFGQELSVRGDLLVAGTPAETELSSSDGAAWLFRDGPAGYELLHRYIAEPGDAFQGGFGAGASVFGDTLAIGHPALIVGGEFNHGGVVIERVPCLDLFQPFCPCVAEAPCAGLNEGAGCVNSTGAGAALAASGSPSASLDDLVLTASGLPANQPGVLFMGDAFGATPLGDGLRCASGSTFRYQIQAADGAGALAYGPGLVAESEARFTPAGHIDAGETWHFQVWYRDAAGPCGNGSNLTSAMQVPFQP